MSPRKPGGGVNAEITGEHDLIDLLKRIDEQINGREAKAERMTSVSTWVGVLALLLSMLTVVYVAGGLGRDVAINTTKPSVDKFDAVEKRVIRLEGYHR